MAVSRIVPGVYVGDHDDAMKWHESAGPGPFGESALGPVLCVIEPLEGYPMSTPIEGELCIPVLQLQPDGYPLTPGGHRIANPEAMHRIVDYIEHHALLDTPLLVHCGAGLERSPFAVAAWLVMRRGKTWDEAYAIIMEARPMAQDRRHWARSWDAKCNSIPSTPDPEVQMGFIKGTNENGQERPHPRREMSEQG